ncbi:hypothetical protein [Oligella ureolytica]|nr:hypothetical protein [Oligella ureolytica]
MGVWALTIAGKPSPTAAAVPAAAPPRNLRRESTGDWRPDGFFTDL